jgi:prophage regulatory protein
MPKVLLRLPEVRRRTGLTTTEIYEAQKLGTFPQSVPIGTRTVGWVDAEVDGWIDGRIKARDAAPEHARVQRSHKGGPGRGHKGPREGSMRIETEL